MNSFLMKTHHTPLIQFKDPQPIKLQRSIEDLYEVVQLQARDRKTGQIVSVKEIKVPKAMLSNLR